ncbi:MAG TPA: hypothetical protein VH089_13935 [Streptosporangiaceae bacterium]|jgi:nucleoside-diphosphate-sugar epimerase|nr:hypothetical protein [Streptosporangiaceae bacterium]
MLTTVFGARGTVGRRVAVGLRAIGEPVRAVSRDPGPGPGGPGLWAAWVGGPVPTSTVTDDVLGRPGRTFAQWAADHAADVA